MVILLIESDFCCPSGGDVNTGTEYSSLMHFLVLNETHDRVDETPDLPSLKQLLPHLLDVQRFLSFKWLAIVDLHCTGEA